MQHFEKQAYFQKLDLARCSPKPFLQTLLSLVSEISGMYVPLL